MRPDIDNFAAAAFEEASLHQLTRLIQSGELVFFPERVGSWWERDVEIDVVAVNFSERTALMGECKWSINMVGINVLQELKKKAGAFARVSGIEQFQYILFSRSGFTADLQVMAGEEGILLVTVQDLVKTV